MVMTDEAWYTKLNVPFLSAKISFQNMLPVLGKHALMTRQQVITGEVYGVGDSGTMKALVDEVLALLPQSWIAESTLEERAHISLTIVSDIGVAMFTLYDKQLSCNFATLSLEKTQEIYNCIRTKVPPFKASKDTIYAIAQSPDGYYLTKVGAIGLPIRAENYSPEAVEQFRHMAADLLADNPCGRLSILSGEPGTGKTFLVRGLVNAGNGKATFVILPPHMIHALGDPHLINLLIKQKYEHDDEPIVLVLEDADSALVPRATDNMHSISGLLNLSDGLLGRALDIRIIATTNAEMKEMDEALIRPGRLCTHITTRRLSIKDGQSLADSIAPGKVKVTQPSSLAEIYKWCSESSARKPTTPKSSMGF